MAKIQTEITISLKENVAEVIEKVTANQIEILRLTSENSEMLAAVIKAGLDGRNK